MLKYQYKNLAYDKQHTVKKLSFTAKVIVHITTNMALRMWLVLVNVALLSVSYGLSTDKSADQVLKRLMSDRDEDRMELQQLRKEVKELQQLREEVRKLSQTVDCNKKVQTLLDILNVKLKEFHCKSLKSFKTLRLKD